MKSATDERSEATQADPACDSVSTQALIGARLSNDHLLKVFHHLFGQHPAQIAMLDMDGTILAVNESWLSFGSQNDQADEYKSVGQNYLDVCQRSAESGDEIASAALSGLLEIIATGRPKFAMTYPCHAPFERRWFKLWIETQWPDSPVLILAHQLIRSEPVFQNSGYAGKWDLLD